MPTPPVLPTWESIEEIVSMLGPAADFRGSKHKEMMDGLIARIKAIENPFKAEWVPEPFDPVDCTVSVISSNHFKFGDDCVFAIKLDVVLGSEVSAGGFGINLPIETFFTNRHELIASVNGELSQGFELALIEVSASGSSMAVAISSQENGISQLFSIVGIYKILPEIIEE